MFNFVRVISRINVAVTAVPKVVKAFSVNPKNIRGSESSDRRSIASDWRKIGQDMERGLIQYDRELTRRAKISGTNK
ncbi:hypothetical protein RA086_05385 [Lactiplantibacillus sp. WILCCON 0030]|uniref:Uncharacterized protein n=1 Tax=Lactiplantibacillus brownii TaxID=3069269 RepID=A0ABU1A810_9LACO|nr:hypothetical protein [Lactiplantibacillus brownii]MDQ7937059.1 hypothetical protein [Lactiplantibacillus brownii]